MSSQRRRNCGIVFLTVLFAPALQVLGGEPSFTKRSDFKVRMSDGVNLAVNVYLPKIGTEFATVLMRTPYSKNGMGWIAEPLAEAGYAVVVQDVRGQFASQGTFIPFIFEKKDGIETLDWVAKQPWCDGNIGMWGPSYLGYCALIVTPEGHPHLKTVINAAGWGDTTLMTAPGGAMHLMVALPWTLSSQISSGGPSGGIKWDEAFQRTPVIEIPTFYGMDSRPWKGMVELSSSPDTDSNMNISRRYEDIKIPTFHISGWYDFVGPTTIDAFEGIDRAARKRNGAMHKLFVGPWLHGQIYNGGTRIGEEDFPPSINVGVDKLADMSVRWFDQWLRGKDTGITMEKPVELFVMGENRWRKFDQWPPKRTRFEPWYFGSDKGANSTAGDGSLSGTEPARSGEDRFVYDPMNPTPTTGGSNSHVFPDNTGIKDQREVEKRSDVLVYTSEVLERDMTIIGPVKAVIFAATEGRHTDFTAKLVEVRPDGYAANIVDAIKRGPDPIDGKRVEHMEPGKVYRFTVDMDATAITIKRGHRLRIEVSSSNFPKYTRNPNTGEVPEYATEFRKVLQTVHHSPEYPSHVSLPVMQR
ncbi:MAG: CocE/NonD family hydrolase [Planctomycetes bacterium]|nr:CocE/NonD family hydrolase [Planctomycetota bacterium]